MSTTPHLYLLLFTGIYFVCGDAAQFKSVRLTSLCRSGLGDDRLVGNNEKLRITLNRLELSNQMLSCTVTFRAENLSGYLFYEISSFALNDLGTTLQFESKNYKAIYSRSNVPSVGTRVRTGSYLRVTITRESTADTSLHVILNVYTEDYNNSFWRPRYLGLTVGPIIGIVVGTILLIVFIIVLMCCLCARSRRNHGVVMTSRPHVATVGSPYPFGHPPEQYAMYPVNQTSAYPPGVYPVTHVSQYSGPPPAYGELATIRSAQPKFESTDRRLH